MASHRPLGRRLAALAFGLSVMLGLGHALCYSTLLPDRVATRFDPSGVPAAWSNRSTMIDLQLTLVVVAAAAFLVLTGVALRSPDRWLRLPRRDWWLAPDRADRTRQDLAARLLYLGAFTQLLLLDLFHRTVRVNLGRVPALESWWPDMGVFALVVGIWFAALVWRYRRRPVERARSAAA